MPKIKIDHVVSFSSEDSIHVANNILSNDPNKKWKCKTAGEKSAIIVLQLEKASIISSIDIGNENSAYVEVLASRSGTIDDYKVLLVMSSFMSPLEARQTTNINKVRMFTSEHLSKPECDEKWDKIKIVCTQPFNRHVQYGLSFINFCSPESKNDSPLSQGSTKIFLLRPESPINDLSSGSLFARVKESMDHTLKGAAAIREASTSASLARNGSPTCKPKLIGDNNAKSTSNNNNKRQSDEKLPQRNRNELLYSKDDEEPNEKIDKIIEKKLKETKKVEEKKVEKKKLSIDSKKEQPSGENKKKRKIESEGKAEVAKKTKTNEEKTVKKLKPFNKLLEGVTLVISGIQNPHRANLRTMALEMGAKYKPDWDSTCSHLICAFPNTPKFNQVKGKGKIVKRKWLEDCHSMRKRLAWRKYALDKTDLGEESEEEICEDVQTQLNTSNNENEATDEEQDGYHEAKMQEKIAQIQEKLNNKKKDVYSKETDVEDNVDVLEEKKIDQTIPNNLSDFFINKTFFIDNSFNDDITKLLNQYITAYKGTVINNLDSIDFYITPDNGLKNSLNDSKALFVNPDWIWECHNQQSFVPIDEYVL